MGYISHRSEESVEDYLETIYILSMRLPTVRSIDIVNEMNFSKPSVSVAMKNLKNKSYIDISGAGHITLSEAGLKLAAEIYERHTVLTDWLISLGVDPKVAAEDACKMEHDISTQSFEAMKRFIQNRL
ncbi:transcriptional regulator MntR [Lachnospiraceae bacterium]|jgi:DtxR family Mn-dependent transcriptional regulator|nr:metal-dependent transcriptional regulator [Dorea sp.]GFI37642.1 transcriptional regulator MntR [Lachnospiraceae bacterium]